MTSFTLYEHKDLCEHIFHYFSWRNTQPSRLSNAPIQTLDLV